MKRPGLILCGALVAACMSLSVQAEQEPVDERESVITATTSATDDAEIAARLSGIYAELETLDGVTVDVAEGIVSLGGSVANEALADQAISLAERVAGVVAVEDGISRTLAVRDNISPLLSGLNRRLSDAYRGLPLLLVALLAGGLVVLAGWQLADYRPLRDRLFSSPFLAELAGQLGRLTAIVLGIVTVLWVMNATTLLGTLLGGAGILGIAVGFAVKDTIENFIASIMLSVRQPFRANDHVRINEHEGVVAKLTSRATILMTLDGNHLRIPNGEVFKGTILNYTRNPERRFEFVIGVDADDDPAGAIETGVATLAAFDWVLAEPAPFAIIEEVGDSNILLRYYGWVDQRNVNFGKSRSAAIRAVKLALESAGYSIPEPIYRVRLPAATAALPAGPESSRQAPAEPPAGAPETGSAGRVKTAAGPDDDTVDISRDDTLQELAEEERRRSAPADNLLDGKRPTE